MSGRLDALSALDWWREAGVDTLVDEEPRDWLRAPAKAQPAAAVLADGPLGGSVRSQHDRAPRRIDQVGRRSTRERSLDGVRTRSRQSQGIGG